MRVLFTIALAGVIFAPAAPAQDKKEEKPMLPNLDAKEWKKEKSGLEIWDVKVGKGEAVKPGATVTIHYTGWLTDDKATKFDSSVDRGKPFSFQLGAGMVIKGWDEGVAGMKVGGKRKLMIPPELGYGARGAGGAIPPNAELIFEVELLKIK